MKNNPLTHERKLQPTSTALSLKINDRIEQQVIKKKTIEYDAKLDKMQEQMAHLLEALSRERENAKLNQGTNVVATPQSPTKTSKGAPNAAKDDNRKKLFEVSLRKGNS